MRKNIAVITGGEAAEVGIALKSAGVIYKHLNKEKYNVYKILIDGKDWWYLHDETRVAKIDKNDFTLLLNGETVRFDAVFVAIHGTPAEDGKLQGYFDLLGIPYNCCGVLQAALTFDKQRTKEYLSVLGIQTAKAVLGFKNDGIAPFAERIKSQLSFPVFVKPNKNGSSYGASKVDSAEQLEAAIAEGFKYDDEVLAETFLVGREVTNGVFTHNGKVTALPITEIKTKNSFFDYKAKYAGESQEVTPAEIGDVWTKKIQETSVKIYEKLGFKGMCRIDYILGESDFHMLEVNSIPGFSEESIVPQQARAVGFTLEEFVGISVEESLRK